MNSLNLFELVTNFSIGCPGVPYESIMHNPGEFFEVIKHIRGLIGKTYIIEYVYGTTQANISDTKSYRTWNFFSSYLSNCCCYNNYYYCTVATTIINVPVGTFLSLITSGLYCYGMSKGIITLAVIFLIRQYLVVL